jgi:hypothetical protein
LTIAKTKNLGKKKRADGSRRSGHRARHKFRRGRTRCRKRRFETRSGAPHTCHNLLVPSRPLIAAPFLPLPSRWLAAEGSCECLRCRPWKPVVLLVWLPQGATAPWQFVHCQSMASASHWQSPRAVRHDTHRGRVGQRLDRHILLGECFVGWASFYVRYSPCRHFTRCQIQSSQTPCNVPKTHSLALRQAQHLRDVKQIPRCRWEGVVTAQHSVPSRHHASHILLRSLPGTQDPNDPSSTLDTLRNAPESCPSSPSNEIELIPVALTNLAVAALRSTHATDEPNVSP